MNDEPPPPANTSVPCGGGELTVWRLGRAERRLDSIEDEYPKQFATKDEHNDLKRILYGCIALVGSTLGIIFASSFHLLFAK